MDKLKTDVVALVPLKMDEQLQVSSDRQTDRPEPHNLLSTMKTWKRKDKTNTQETKLKDTIQTGKRKRTNRQRQRVSETKTTAEREREG